MPNRIKESGEKGVALQVTKPARATGMVEETSEGKATRLADVRVFSFDGLLMVVDLDRVDTEDVAELVASAAGDTKSIYRAKDASLQISGGGYQVQLPPADDAGFSVGDSAPTHTAPGVIFITPLDSGGAARLAADLVSIREDQTGG